MDTKEQSASILFVKGSASLRHDGEANRGGTVLSRFPEQDPIIKDQKR
ncbi:hypothetical protein [Streptomyces aureocirculatus]|nr:hypothetical protein [Streptomyces aureocirculatus]